MCTCINFKTKDFYFGRTLDLTSHFREKVVITPRNYEFLLKNGSTFRTKYSMIGMAMVCENYPFYAEASNEKGLSIAGLYFPNSAYYFSPDPAKLNLTPYEIIPYFLGQYSSIYEMKERLSQLNLTNLPFSDQLPLTDLHWMISDEKECIVLEQTKYGLKVYDNPIGVLTNNPPFYYHLLNLSNYSNLTPSFSESKFSDQISLQQYGQGMGAIGLPGDNSPASRFVRIAFHKLNSVCKSDEESSITQFFHLLDSVSMIQGSTITKENQYDITLYSCCINATKGIYYYKTYSNNQITAVRMTENEQKKKELSIFPFVEKQQIRYENELR